MAGGESTDLRWVRVMPILQEMRYRPYIGLNGKICDKPEQSEVYCRYQENLVRLMGDLKAQRSGTRRVIRCWLGPVVLKF